ncbi:MAG: hypothetical protein ABI456_12185, partial [Ktedonobacteraceae bacterium]
MPRTREASFSDSQEWKLIVTFFVVNILLMTFFLAVPRQAMANVGAIHTVSLPVYSCGDVGSNHCYGVDDWRGGNTGAYTSINVVQLHAGNGIMNNSVWAWNADTKHWMEAGYAVIYNHNYEFWYWAYIDNNGTYHERDSGAINSGDFGNEASVYVWQSSSTSWQSAIYGWVTNYLPGSVTASIKPNYIQIGQELGGTSGSSAYTANWNYNEWRGSNKKHGQSDPCLHSSPDITNYIANAIFLLHTIIR